MKDSAELFLDTDHHLLVATLRLRLKSVRKAPSTPRLDVSRLRDEVVATDFTRERGSFNQTHYGNMQCSELRSSLGLLVFLKGDTSVWRDSTIFEV